MTANPSVIFDAPIVAGRSESDILERCLAIAPDAMGCRDSRTVFPVDKDGYPLSHVGAAGRYRMLRVTRMVLSSALGRPITRNEHACHHCDHPWCVEVTHLWSGSNRDNTADKIAKGRARYVSGDESPNAVLTSEAVHIIRAEYRPGRHRSDLGNASELAARFGVSRGTLIRAATGKSWRAS